MKNACIACTLQQAQVSESRNDEISRQVLAGDVVTLRILPTMLRNQEID